MPGLWAEEFAAYERDVLEPEAAFLRAEAARGERLKVEQSEHFARAFHLPQELAPLLKVAIYSSSMRLRVEAADLLIMRIEGES